MEFSLDVGHFESAESYKVNAKCCKFHVRTLSIMSLVYGALVHDCVDEVCKSKPQQSALPWFTPYVYIQPQERAGMTHVLQWGRVLTYHLAASLPQAMDQE